MKTLNNTAACAVILATIAGATGAYAGPNTDRVLDALRSGKAPHAADEILVQYKEGAVASDQSAVRGKISAKAQEVLAQRGGKRLELLKLPKGRSVESAILALEADPSVEFAEPNWVYTHQATSNDSFYTSGQLWGMYGDALSPTNQYGSQANEPWAANRTDCGSVWVGVIDEGYMYTHPDLAANAGTNPGEVAGNGVDDDGNGYVDDVYGWDFAGGNNSVFDGLSDDHGTHVAGTIGGVGGNGAGVAGVCWSVKLMNAKFLGSNGGTTANAIKAVDYFTDLKTRHGLNLVATNNSWGGGGFSQGLADAIERANDAGILFVAAAGNSSVNCDTSSACYPAEYASANVIAVASINSNGTRSSFTNYGATTVDIGAPGGGIISTVPVRSRGKIVGGYASYSGTSMASPHVAGAAALYKAYNPAASAADIKAAILGSAAPTASLNGYVLTDGRLDLSGF